MLVLYSFYLAFAWPLKFRHSGVNALQKSNGKADHWQTSLFVPLSYLTNQAMESRHQTWMKYNSRNIMPYRMKSGDNEGFDWSATVFVCKLVSVGER